MSEYIYLHSTLHLLSLKTALSLRALKLFIEYLKNKFIHFVFQSH